MRLDKIIIRRIIIILLDTSFDNFITDHRLRCLSHVIHSFSVGEIKKTLEIKMFVRNTKDDFLITVLFCL